LRDNGGILSDKEDSGGVQATADALLASLLNAQLDSFSPARVTLYDPARFEAKINGQLSNDIGNAWDKDHSVAVSGSSKDFAVNLFSSYVPPFSPPPLALSSLASLPWFRGNGDHPISTSLFSVGSSLQLWVGLYGSVPCDLPHDVVRDALALSVGLWNFAGVSEDNVAGGSTVHNWPLISVGSPSGSEDLVAPLVVDFSLLQNFNETFSVRMCGMVIV